MDDLGELKVTGIVDASEAVAKPVNIKCKAVLEAIALAIKGKPDKAAVIDQPLKTKAEAMKKARILRSQKRLLGSDYDGFGVTVSGTEEAGYRVFGIDISQIAQAGKATGNKKHKADAVSKTGVKSQKKAGSGAPAASVSAAGEQAASAEDGIKQLIQQVEAGQMPDAVLPGILKKYEQLISGVEQKLSAQGVAEADAAKWKNDIGLMRAAVEAIKKKMGQQ